MIGFPFIWKQHFKSPWTARNAASWQSPSLQQPCTLRETSGLLRGGADTAREAAQAAGSRVPHLLLHTSVPAPSAVKRSLPVLQRKPHCSITQLAFLNTPRNESRSEGRGRQTCVFKRPPCAQRSSFPHCVLWTQCDKWTQMYQWHLGVSSSKILHTLPLPGKAAGKVRPPSLAAVQAPWEQHSPAAQKLLLSQLLLLGVRNWPRWFQNLPGNNITILNFKALSPTS